MIRLALLTSLVLGTAACQEANRDTIGKAPTLSEIEQIVVAATELAVRTRQTDGDVCLVTKLAQPDGQVVPARQSAIPELRALPRNAAPSIRRTHERFGCPETLMISEPEFQGIGTGQQSANVYIDELCGALCGERYVVAFSRANGHWRPLDQTPRPTGVSY